MKNYFSVTTTNINKRIHLGFGRRETPNGLATLLPTFFGVLILQMMQVNPFDQYEQGNKINVLWIPQSFPHNPQKLKILSISVLDTDCELEAASEIFKLG